MNWLWKNLWLKVVAFGLGFLVWIHVATEKTYNYEIKLPVTEVVVKEGLALAKQPPDSVRVAVTASGKQLLRRKWRERGIRVNATQYQSGRHTMVFSPVNCFLAHPSTEVTLDEVISPTRVQLEIDMETSVEIPIVADLITSADDGFAVGQSFTIDPPVATLTGPRSALQTVSNVLTERRTLESLRNSVSITLAIEPPANYGFRVAPDSVLVSIPVSPVRTRVFEKVPILVFNAPTAFEVSTYPTELRLEVVGPPTEIDQLDANDLTLSVDYTRQGDRRMAAVKFDCPAGFRLRAISADSVLIMETSDASPGN